MSENRKLCDGSRVRIRKLNEARFGTTKVSRVVSGYALYEEGKGYIAFSHDRDQFGILIPYVPCGGERALQSILDAGGFCSSEGMEYVEELPIHCQRRCEDVSKPSGRG